ncbi:MAG: radical SAM protein [Anaerolineales bacterium]|nr:radical SAM protein [Anaerolineales bacterium]
MIILDQISADLPAFRQAVLSRQAYRPLYVKIKLIYGCNLRCEMCNHWREQREAPLPAARLFELLDELSSLGCQKVHFSGGEPLLRPETPDLIEHAAGLGMRVTLTTNGTLLDKEMARRLVENGLRGVNVSIDSPDRKTHDRIRGLEGAWKKACRAVRLFRRYEHKGKLTIRINTVISQLNFRGLERLPELAQELGADEINLIPVDDHCGKHLALSRQHIEAFNAWLAPSISQRAAEFGIGLGENQGYPFGHTPQEGKRARRGEYALGWYENHPCFAPWTHSLVDYNGLVYVCCMTREQMAPMGDLKESKFQEIWNGPGYLAARGQMFPPELPSCRRCDDFLEQNRRLLELLQGQDSG